MCCLRIAHQAAQGIWTSACPARRGPFHGSWYGFLATGKREMFGKPSLRELANKAGQAGFASCASLCAANLCRGFS
jgi:hypothetical protein